jgi:Tfp pilus assembly protein PilN
MANLLPWRKHENDIIFRNFLTIIFSCSILLIATAAIVDFCLWQTTKTYRIVNSQMQQTANNLNIHNQQLLRIKNNIDNLTSEINRIKSFTDANNKALLFLKNLNTLLPGATALTRLTKDANKISINGIAYSYNDLKNLLAKITNTKIFTRTEFNLSSNKIQNTAIQFSISCYA